MHAISLEAAVNIKRTKAEEAVRLLQENLEQEQHTLTEVRQATRTVARDSTAKAA
jgi:hypothetical protein